MIKSNSEIETIILINEGDRAEGYYQFGTSNPAQYQKLKAKVHEKNFKHLAIERDKNGKPVWWQVQIPIEYLPGGPFYARRRIEHKRIWSEQEKEVVRDRLALGRSKKLSKLG